MLIGVGVSCRFSYSIVIHLFVSCIGLITSVGRELIFLLSFTFNYVVSVVGGSSSSWLWGWATLFYCGTPQAFHLIILYS